MSFNFMGYYRVGSYKVLRSFILHELRSARQRIRTIEAELVRIGSITVLYKKVPSGTVPEGQGPALEGGGTASEERVGLSVTPDSSVCRLVQAYIAQGGNPYDISMFLNPNSSNWVDVTDYESADESTETTIVENQSQPYGGVLYPISRFETDYRSGGLGEIDSGGMLTGLKNPKTRLANKPVENRPNYDKTRRSQYILRKAFRQAIRDKRNNLEYRILKLMDLREQLEHEKSELMMACGGFIAGVQDSAAAAGAGLSTMEIIDDLDTEIFTYTQDADELCLGVDTSKVRQGIRSYIFIDYVQEKWTGL